ncbi:MAG TPA: hypothetical protein VHO01_10995 [Jatrophihabitans sp.]|nr:hypothetical protein [Jatrophihabitans sp.]
MATVAAAALLVPTLSAAASTGPDRDRHHEPGAFVPGDLLLNTTVFPQLVAITAGTTQLPPNCGTGPFNAGKCSVAAAGGSYPQVFDNSIPDGSFGLGSKIVLDELNPASGATVRSIEVPNSTEPWVRAGSDQMVTSFSSKSEGALTLSPDGHDVTFMGYDAPVGGIDISNSDTPGVDDQSRNPAASRYYRVVGDLGADGRLHYTLTNAFSGDNARAAIIGPRGLAYVAGNGDDKGGTNFILAAGAQLVRLSDRPEVAQAPGAPTPVGSFSVNELGVSESGDAAKDNNYRGIAIENNVLYFSKGSGGKGVNTVYFVDTTGKACPNGVGLPLPGAQLPTAPLAGGNPEVAAEQAPRPYNMCILKGFPAVPNASNAGPDYPFGMFFAGPHTLYVADEGSGDGPANGDYSAADAAHNPTAGLQKWVFDTAAQQWKLAYTLQAGLALGQPYSVANYPTGTNPATGEPWAPATDGLRNLTGRINRDGTVSIYAVTSTISGSSDAGADPNKLVSVTDPIAATSPVSGEAFRTLKSAPAGSIFRGVSFAPTSGDRR